MIEGHIESLTADGVFAGWVRESGSRVPCHVQVLHGGAMVAEAMAAAFRADLLRTGHGHGHYGFSARLLRPLPPGPCAVGMHLPRHGLTAPMGLVVPPLRAASALPVEALLATPPTWCVADILAAPGCVDAPGNLARMGSARFVDAGYRFVLARWPTKAEVRLHTDNLAHKRVGPQDFLLDLLRSRERADMGEELPSPFDSRFAFQ